MRAEPDFSRRWGGQVNVRMGGAEQAAEKRLIAANHPGAQGATPPDSGGEFLKTVSSSVEEGWRAGCRGGAEEGNYQRCLVIGGAEQTAEKLESAVILSPFAVILSAAKNRALSIFKAMRDSSFAVLRTACCSSE
jgi:hypothetical protein